MGLPKRWTKVTKEQWEKDMRDFSTALLGAKNSFIVFGHALYRMEFRKTINSILEKYSTAIILFTVIKIFG